MSATKTQIEEYEAARTVGGRYRGTVGLLYGGALQSVHETFLAMAPPDVNVLIMTTTWSKAMLHAGDFDADAFAERRADLVETARATAGFTPLDSLCIGGDLVQAAMGRTWSQELAVEVEEAIGVRTHMAMELVCSSLRYLDAQNVALVSPFPKKRSDHLRGYLEEAGFDVPVIRGVETTTVDTIRELPREAPYDVTARALTAAEEQDVSVDAVYLTCPVWNSNEVVERLEQRFGVPVVTMFSPVLWQGLRDLDVTEGVTGYGRLLARPRSRED